MVRKCLLEVLVTKILRSGRLQSFTSLELQTWTAQGQVSNPGRNAHDLWCVYLIYDDLCCVYFTINMWCFSILIWFYNILYTVESSVPSFNPYIFSRVNCPSPRTCVGKAAVCMVPMAVAVPELLGFAVPGGPWWRYHGLVLVSWG